MFDHFADIVRYHVLNSSASIVLTIGLSISLTISVLIFSNWYSLYQKNVMVCVVATVVFSVASLIGLVTFATNEIRKQSFLLC